MPGSLPVKTRVRAKKSVASLNALRSGAGLGEELSKAAYQCLSHDPVAVLWHYRLRQGLLKPNYFCTEVLTISFLSLPLKSGIEVCILNEETSHVLHTHG